MKLVSMDAGTAQARLAEQLSELVVGQPEAAAVIAPYVRMYQAGLRNYADAIGAHPSGFNVAPDVPGGAPACDFIRGQGSLYVGPCNSPHHSWSFRSTMEGFRWCIDNGIYPKYAVWIKGGGALYSEKTTASLDYFIRLALEREAVMKTSGLPKPAIDCYKCATQSLEYDFENLAAK